MSNGFVILAEFDVPAEQLAEFLFHVRSNAAASVRDEAGCRRFDVLQPETAGEPVALYEIYRDRAAFEAHLRTPHFAAFDAATKALVRGRSVRRFALHEHAAARA